ncbi:MAG: hypothetical protein AVDCRST_MAG79-741, partial [uncultured Thermoleophilia bacterium]
ERRRRPSPARAARPARRGLRRSRGRAVPGGRRGHDRRGHDGGPARHDRRGDDDSVRGPGHGSPDRGVARGSEGRPLDHPAPDVRPPGRRRAGPRSALRRPGRPDRPVRGAAQRRGLHGDLRRTGGGTRDGHLPRHAGRRPVRPHERLRDRALVRRGRRPRPV